MLVGVDARSHIYPGAIWSATWPLALGLLIAFGAIKPWRRLWREVDIPPGDLIVLAERGAVGLRQRADHAPTAEIAAAVTSAQGRARSAAVALAVDGTIERWLTGWIASRAMMIVLLVLLALMLTW